MPVTVKITKLPSGRYNARVYDYTDENGKRHDVSITRDTRAEVEKAVKKHQAEHTLREKTPSSAVTVEDALRTYVESRRNVLSPSTYRTYSGYLRNHYQQLASITVSQLTETDVQQYTNRLAEKHSPKTVRNVVFLLMSAVQSADKTKTFSLTFPQKRESEIEIPTDAEVKAVLADRSGTVDELPILLAALCGMRESEIYALRFDRDVDLEAGTLTIREASVRNDEGVYVTKGTKTRAGTRTIHPPRVVMKAMMEALSEGKTCVGVKPAKMYYHFSAALKRLGLPHYRFHALRHYCVSVMLSLGIPKNYIANYVGHETEHLIDCVYGHIMKDAKTAFEDRLNAHYELIMPKQ